MKNPMDVLRMKELELTRVKKEIEALQLVSRLLTDESIPANGQTQDLRQLLEMP
jgi:hypothetical protein